MAVVYVRIYFDSLRYRIKKIREEEKKREEKENEMTPPLLQEIVRISYHSLNE